MADLVLQHLSKRYPNGVMAVGDLSLSVAEGELLVLVGPSGCGKSTTLRLIAGLETPTSGTLHIAGIEATHLPPRQRDVAIVFQRPALYPHLSVAENLAVGQRLRRGHGLLPRLFRRATTRAAEHELSARVAEAARTLGLEGLLQRRPGELSGGQQQRVALGRALVRRPAVFLLDEPLSNLEPGLRHDLRRELHLLQRRLRATMIYVTHDQVEALTLGDRVVVLNAGKVQQVGRPWDLYQRPANRFVAGFLGWPPMNFFDGRVLRAEDGRLHVARLGISWPLPRELVLAEEALSRQAVTVGIRPEQVILGNDPGRERARGIEQRMVGEVLLVEPLGASQLVTVGWGEWQLTAQVEGQPLFRERQTVEVGWDMRQVYLFDRTNGATLGGGAPKG